MLFILGSCAIPAQAEDPRILGFIIGRPVGIANIWTTPMRILSIKDPLFLHAEYPLRGDLLDSEKRKLDRIYYPRTGQDLIDSYDYVVLHSAQIQHFLPRQIHDLDHAFREAGMTAFMALDLSWDYSIQPSILREVVPVSEHYSVSPSADSFSVRFHRNRDPVFTPFIALGAEKVKGEIFCEMIPRQGATVWGDLIQSSLLRKKDLPWLISWKPGGGDPGMQWIVAHTFGSWWFEDNNPHALDMSTNMVFYSLDRPLISDILGRREARRLFFNIHTQKSLILSMMEWAESFGADVASITEMLSEIELELVTAKKSYFEQDYPPAINYLDSMTSVVMEITEYAVDIKNEAMFWVYLSEWLVTSSVGLISAVFLWSLMVRRRAFRAVQVTKLKPIDDS